MKIFLTDLWSDLREKRLWPVAVLLLAALVAIPVVVVKPAEEPETPIATAPPADLDGAAAAAGAVVTAEDPQLTASRLDAFKSRDPFDAPGSSKKKPAAAMNDSSSTTTAKGGSPAPVSKAPSSGRTGGTTGGTGGGSTGGGTTGGGTTGGTGGGSGGDKVYVYTVDLRFGERGEERKYESVQRMSFLPDDKNPLVVFLGMSASGKTAIFMVDTDKLAAEGEGSCRPNRSTCTFLYLRADDEHNDHFLTDRETGVQYRLKLLDIDIVETDELESRKKAESGGSSSSKLEKKGERRPFRFMPVLADERR